MGKNTVSVEMQKKTNGVLKRMNNRFSSLLEDLDMVDELTDELLEDSANEFDTEDLFEDENLEEDYEDLFEDENLEEDFEDSDYDDLFEDSDYDDDLYEDENLEEGVYLGHEDIDGERVEYYMIEPGQFDEGLDSNLANFRVKRRSYVNTLMEDENFDDFMEILMEERKPPRKSTYTIKKGKQAGQTRTRRGPGLTNKPIITKDKDKNGRKLKKTNPTQAINLLKKKKSIMTIFKYNKKLKKKLMRFANGDGQSGPFNKRFEQNINWIPVNMKEVLETLSAKNKTFDKTEKMLKYQLQTLNAATSHDKDHLAQVVLDSFLFSTDKKTANLELEGIETIRGSLGNFEKMINDMAAAKKAAVLMEASQIESIEELDDLMEAVTSPNFKFSKDSVKEKKKKNAARKKAMLATSKTVKGMLITGDGTAMKTMPDGVNSVIKKLGTYLVSALMYGAGTGKFGAKFFAAVDRKSHGKNPAISKKGWKAVMEVRDTRALAGKLAHDFKWLATFNKYGLLGAKIEQKTKNDSTGKMDSTVFAIHGSDEIKEWLKKNASKIEKLMLNGVPDGGWGGHRVGGKRNLSKSVEDKMDKDKGKNVRYLLEDADALSPDNLALLTSLY